MSINNSYQNETNTVLHHLNSLVGGHMRAMDKTLSHISGRKPWAPIKWSKSLSGNPFDNALMGMAQSSLGAGLKQLVGSGSGNGGVRLSQGQTWADAASAITNALKRSL